MTPASISMQILKLTKPIKLQCICMFDKCMAYSRICCNNAEFAEKYRFSPTH